MGHLSRCSGLWETCLPLRGQMHQAEDAASFLSKPVSKEGIQKRMLAHIAASRTLINISHRTLAKQICHQDLGEADQMQEHSTPHSCHSSTATDSSQCSKMALISLCPFLTFLRRSLLTLKEFLDNDNSSHCMGFVWQGFGSGGATGLAAVKSSQKLPPCLTKLMPAGSRMDLPLAKAKPIRNGGTTFGITWLRRGQKLLCN